MTKLDHKKSSENVRMAKRGTVRVGEETAPGVGPTHFSSDQQFWPVDGRRAGDLYHAITAKKPVAAQLIWCLQEIDCSSMKACSLAELQECLEVCKSAAKRIVGQAVPQLNTGKPDIQNRLLSENRNGLGKLPDSKLIQDLRTIDFLTKDAGKLKEYGEPVRRECEEICYSIIRQLREQIAGKARLKPRRP